MEDMRTCIQKYKKQAAETADALSKAADALRHGELSAADEGERISHMMADLKEARGRMQLEAEKMDADISEARTVGELERQCARHELEALLLSLDAIQSVTASEEKYAVPMKELQSCAKSAAQSLRAADGPAPEESRRASEQAKAILEVLDSGGPDAGSEENIFARLGISDTILLGLMLGKYSRAESAESREDRTAAEGGAECEEISETTAANGEVTAEEIPAAESEPERERPYRDEPVHPLHKLENHKPNAQRFFNMLHAAGPGAEAAVVAVYCHDASTHSQAAVMMQGQVDFPIPRQIKDVLQRVMRRLAQIGILAAYRIDGETVYLLTRFALECMKMPEVRRRLIQDSKSTDGYTELAAEETMSKSLLMIRWTWNEVHARLDNWLRRELGVNLPDNWKGDRDIDNQYGIQFPKGYGHGQEPPLNR